MTGVERLLATAKAEEGYLEKSKAAYIANPNILDSKTDGAGSDNYTKYSRDLWKEKYFNSSKQGVAWCAVFASWCFYTTFGKSLALKLQCQPSSNNAGAGCSSAANYYKTKGRFYSYPEPGDQIFFNASDGDGYGHTGIVESVTNSKVYTIEGNTSAGKDVIANGGSVCRKSYALNNSRIGGYGRPDWSIVPDEVPVMFIDKEGEKMVEVIEYNAKVVAPSGKTVNLRKTASTNAAVLAQVPIGDIVIVVEHENDTWARVSYAKNSGVSVNGYMMRNFLESLEPVTEIGAGVAEGDITREEFNSLRNRVEAIEKRLGM